MPGYGPVLLFRSPPILATLRVSLYSHRVMKTSVRNTTGMQSIMAPSMMTIIIETITLWPAEPDVC